MESQQQNTSVNTVILIVISLIIALVVVFWRHSTSESIEVQDVKKQILPEYSVAMDLGGAYDSNSICESSSWTKESDHRGRTFVINTCEYSEDAIRAVNVWNLKIAVNVLIDRSNKIRDIIKESALTEAQKQQGLAKLASWVKDQTLKLQLMEVSTVVMENRFLVNKDESVVPQHPTFIITSETHPYLNYTTTMSVKTAMRNIFADQVDGVTPDDFAMVADDYVAQYSADAIGQFKLLIDK